MNKKYVTINAIFITGDTTTAAPESGNIQIIMLQIQTIKLGHFNHLHDKYLTFYSLIFQESCGTGYVVIDNGDIGGVGSINGRGGSEVVQSCDDCATLCNAETSCGSYECDWNNPDDSNIKCNLNKGRESRDTTTSCGAICQRMLFCVKEGELFESSMS